MSADQKLVDRNRELRKLLARAQLHLKSLRMALREEIRARPQDETLSQWRDEVAELVRDVDLAITAKSEIEARTQGIDSALAWLESQRDNLSSGEYAALLAALHTFHNSKLQIQVTEPT
jgi:hypothetical protein